MYRAIDTNTIIRNTYCISISNNSAGPFIGCLINVSSFTINLHLPRLAAAIEVEACYFWVISLMSRDGVKIAFAWRAIMTEEKSVKTNRRVHKAHGVSHADISDFRRFFLTFFFIYRYKKYYIPLADSIGY